MHTVAQIALAVDGVVQGEAHLTLSGLASLRTAGPHELSFFSAPRQLEALRASRAGAVLVGRHSPPEVGPAGPALILCPDPRQAMAIAADLLRPPHRPVGVHPSAVVDPSAKLAADVYVGPLAVIEAGAVVGEGVLLGPQTFVGAGAQIGAHSRLAPGAKVMAGCQLGRRVLLLAGAVVGSFGFGFAADGQGGRRRMPQLGIVRLGDDCEVGANSCIDRGCLDDTVMGRGVKIDNQVQVGHNSVFGDHVLMCAQSGAAGSSTFGAGVMVGAQAGISDHLHIASGVRLAARAGVIQSIETPGATLGGIPAMPHGRWLRSARVAQDLPSLRRRIEALERAAAEDGPEATEGAFEAESTPQPAARGA